MTGFIEMLEIMIKYVVEICTVFLELAGIVVLVSSAVICFIKWIRRDRENVRLDLAMSIALALEFKMGGEVLRTVVVREWEELLILGSIILLRAAMTFMIHWEIENERKELRIAGKYREQPHNGHFANHKNTNKKYKKSEDRHVEQKNTISSEPYSEDNDVHEENFRRPSLSSDSDSND